MAAINFRDAYEFDPETYNSPNAGGLLGRLQAMAALQGQPQPTPGVGSPPNGGSEYRPDSYGSPQGGLLGRLLALQAEQDRYQPIPASEYASPFAQRNPDFRQLTRVGSNVSSSASTSVMPAPVSPQTEADQAQEAREVAAARLARGVRSDGRAGDINGPPDTVNPITGTVRAFANGAPFLGAFNNNIGAALGASLAPTLNPLFAPEERLNEPTWSARYKHALQDQNDIDSRFAKEHPVVSTMAGFAGGMDPIGILKQAPLGAKMLGLNGGPLLEEMLRGAATRAGIWGTDAAARGNTDKSLVLPMLFGAAAPAAGPALNVLRRWLY